MVVCIFNYVNGVQGGDDHDNAEHWTTVVGWRGFMAKLVQAEAT